VVKNLCIRESYKGKDGMEKVSWNVIGVLIETNEGKQFVKLHTIPGVLISVFAPKAKEPIKPNDANPDDF
jgi:hypothetical protein